MWRKRGRLRVPAHNEETQSGTIAPHLTQVSRFWSSTRISDRRSVAHASLLACPYAAGRRNRGPVDSNFIVTGPREP
jgi:hypothetical protein